MVQHPFAVVDILPGDEIGAVNTKMQLVAKGLLGPIGTGVSRDVVVAGEPVLASDVVARDSYIPDGWWIVAADIPPNVRPGDRVRVVLLNSGEMVDGVVTSGFTDDPFSNASGAIAVESSRASEVAVAAADGSIAVLVSTG
jgi:hypothetical protein